VPRDPCLRDPEPSIIPGCSLAEEKFKSAEDALAALENPEQSEAAGKYLDISCVDDLDSQRMSRLTTALRELPTLEAINLAWNPLSGPSFPELVEVLTPMQNLTEVDLKGTDIAREGATVMSKLLSTNGSITLLDLVHNSIRTAGAEALAEGLRENKCLRELRLGTNDIGDDGAIAVAVALQENTVLTCLQVDKNDIGPKGAEALATTLTGKNSTLEALEIQENCIGDFGADKLAQVLQSNGTIKRLDIRQNEISDVGAMQLMAAHQAAEDVELDIRENDLSEELHLQLDEDCAPGLHHRSETPPEFLEQEMGDEDHHLTEEQGDMQDPSKTLHRMLGIVEDQDDIAFDNAMWYLTTQPQLAPELWTLALESAHEAPKVRCAEIFRQVVTRTTAGQTMTYLDEEALRENFLYVLCCVEHLPQIVAWLSQPPEQHPTLTTTFGCIEERFGLLRTRSVDLLHDLVEARNSFICDKIAESGALPIVFDQFFKYAWNSALHSTVLCIVKIIFDLEEAGKAFDALQRCLLRPKPEGCGFLTRLMEAFEATTPKDVEVPVMEPSYRQQDQEPLDPEAAKLEQRLVAASKSVGYMSAVMEMALCFKKASENSLALREVVDEIQEATQDDTESVRWTAFCEDLERFTDVDPDNRCLGGEKPRPTPTCGQQ
jgi:hypothetical protein